jgi:hypothetical protein
VVLAEKYGDFYSAFAGGNLFDFFTAETRGYKRRGKEEKRRKGERKKAGNN